MNQQIPAPFGIQLAIDGSEYSIAATELVRDLLLPPGSQITILGVVTPGRPPDEGTLQTAIVKAEESLAGSGVEIQTIFLHGHAAKRLIKYGGEHTPDLMVMGANRKGLYAILEILLGGTAPHVFQNARCPVLMARAPYSNSSILFVRSDLEDKDNEGDQM